MSEPKGKKQIERSILCAASLETVWGVLTDSRLLPEWAPVVNQVLSCDTGGERPGSRRACAVSLAGRTGTIVERVLEITDRSSIIYVVEEDSFGMGKMFAHYAFRLSVCRAQGQTRITSETFYTPRNPIYWLMNHFMMKRQFSKVVEGILRGLSDFAAKREASSALALQRV